MLKTVTDNTDFSVAEANQVFVDLADSVRARALWFLAPDAHLDIAAPEADRILDAIVRGADRETWLRARRLQKWRLHHCR